METTLSKYKSAVILIVLSFFSLILSGRTDSIYLLYSFLIFASVGAHMVGYIYLKTRMDVRILTRLNRILLMEIALWVLVFTVSYSMSQYGFANTERFLDLIPILFLSTVGLSWIIGYWFFFVIPAWRKLRDKEALL